MASLPDIKTFNLDHYQKTLDAALGRLAQERILERIWLHDHTVWNPSPVEISNRLGWLHSAQSMLTHIDAIQTFVQSVKEAGYRKALLLGMGGSSLAPEVFRKVFGVAKDHLDLAVLDSTDPQAIADLSRNLKAPETLFIVATKSGGTVETLSFFKHFYNWVAGELGSEEAGQHFVAITDPGSPLTNLARQHGFRQVFRNDPNIGGRYSALSHFGLVPAALVGVDLEKLLGRAIATAARCGPGVPPEDNPAAHLGTILGELTKAGRDKATLVLSPEIASFGDWVEQLIAESTGKGGKGILPVVGEALGEPAVYGDDRLFVALHLAGEEGHQKEIQALADSGQPIVQFELGDRYDLGGQFFLWELAVAIAGYSIVIQPFDQPNVEAAKVLARQMVARYQQDGQLPSGENQPPNAKALSDFLDGAKRGDYIALQAYLPPGEANTAALQELRLKLRDKYKLATTLGYGPRFLHSTGQLHKGDAGNGLFIQLVSAPEEDIPIPSQAGREASEISFGVLKQAQALGDAQALREAGRRVIGFELESPIQDQIKSLTDSIEP